MLIEPKAYLPIIPLVLVNGAEGIGTGWSTSVPCFNPLEIVKNIRAKLRDPSFKFKRMLPWYKNFCGQIEASTTENGQPSFVFYGKWRETDPYSIEITELPIRRWTRDYKTMLEEYMMKSELIEDIKEFHKDNTVHFRIKLQDSVKAIEKRPGGLVKALRLTQSFSAGNYVLFDKDGRLVRYADEVEILAEFFDERYKLYEARK